MQKFIAVITLGLLCLSSGTFAGKVYKWTDSDGNVHYGERAPNTQAQEVQIRHAPPSASNSSAPAYSVQDTNKLLDTLAQERKAKAEKQAKAEKEQQMRELNCSRAKRKKAGYDIGGRIYEVDERGERSYLSDKEIQQRRNAAQQEVEKWCN